LYITGKNNFGQQANGGTEDVFEFRKVEGLEELSEEKHLSFAAGSEHNIVIIDDSLYSWGWN
jgi:alpha-tubulin suppressor-like RCC1 family protein